LQVRQGLTVGALLGADMVQRYFQVMQHCAGAAQIKLERIA